MNDNYRVATRGSKLALIQTEILSRSLRSIFPSMNCDIIRIKSMGDIKRNKFLFSVNEKGIFEKEVDKAVLDERADFAVHSIKDIPTELDGDLVIASILKRESPNDVLIGKSKMKLEQLPKNSRVGTSSLRRAVQIKRKNPNVTVIPIRGNVESRVKKCLDGPFDALVLAEAGLKRLELSNQIIQRFSYLEFVPAPGQGAIGIVCRKDNKKALGVLQKVEDKSTRYAIDAERSLIQYLNAGCRFPVGAIAIPNLRTKRITLHASVFSADGSQSINLKKSDVISNAVKVGKEVANDLLSRGAGDFAHEWREALEKWTVQ
ncbi:MAG: hydroxymethylbilane synthase [Nitrososphaeraceae archaeon]|nr:hydroxymethylbilane synthase [Nitrososphaeraceae archaeon]MDW0211974.1 hydroxymethylbilane synthase [Nitrososphaeraceae archaeon]MDW0225404.1 hydroxymethylbilane synthase [Nitrososphaeraceae archaeon]MDW0228548.1 hydroxymethylbilane synthase [Nitrososphaeraceae archaeon]MDW0234745.1 hydroxymethylbilane synthase [Nitrososphaeraceae archaeon]